MSSYNKLREEFKLEANMPVMEQAENDDTVFTWQYVKWLEDKVVKSNIVLADVVGQSEQLDCIDCDYVKISDNTIECRNCRSVLEFAS